MASHQQHQTLHILCGATVVLWICAGTLGSASAQSGACILSPDKRNPNEKILRCGSALTITPAPGTIYRPAAAADDGLPASVQLDSGALLIEFNLKGDTNFKFSRLRRGRCTVNRSQSP